MRNVFYLSIKSESSKQIKNKFNNYLKVQKSNDDYTSYKETW